MLLHNRGCNRGRGLTYLLQGVKRKKRRKERKNHINTNTEPDAPTECNRKNINKRKKGGGKKWCFFGGWGKKKEEQAQQELDRIPNIKDGGGSCNMVACN